MVIVPLATPDDAGADTRTKTVQRCSYDPFAGRQCWTETVNVSHVHRCGAGLTGTYPNCYPIPPVTQPVCPAGMTGTPPNCYPPPPATTEPPPPPTTAPPPPTTQPPPTTTVYVPPTTTTTAPPQCPAGETGTPPNCQKAECRAGQTGTPPDCKTGRDPTRCATGYHRNGSTCHANHDWTKIPCGTGTWTPHVGHTPKQQSPCEDDKDDEDRWLHACRHIDIIIFGGVPHAHDGLACHDSAPPDHHCGQGEHTHDGKNCHSQETVHPETNEIDTFANLVIESYEVRIEATQQVVCTLGTGGIAAKAAKELINAGAKVWGWIAGAVLEQELPGPCDALYERIQKQVRDLIEDGRLPGTGDDDQDDESDDDSDSDDDSYTPYENDDGKIDADGRARAEEQWRKGNLPTAEFKKINRRYECDTYGRECE